MAPPAGWHPDPERRFEFRYHNGTAWTRDVSIGGRRYVDVPRPVAGEPASPSQQASGGPPTPHHAGPGGGVPSASGRATAAMIVGIIAVSVAWLPLLFVVGIAGGVTAIVLGATRSRAKHPTPGRNFARAGIVTGAAAVVLSAVGIWFTAAVFQAIDSYENPAAHDVEITTCTGPSSGDRGTLAVVEGAIRNTEPEAEGSASYTIRVEIDRSDSGRTIDSATVRVSDIAPGETRTFEIQRRTTVPDIDCTVARVDGPLPFGFDPG